MGEQAEKTVSLSQLSAKVGGCAGCRNNYYNHAGNSESGFCWSLGGAKKRYRWAINMQTPMDRRDRFRKTLVYNCYHGEGPYRDIYLERLPAHLGGDWADKKEQKEKETAVSP